MLRTSLRIIPKFVSLACFIPLLAFNTQAAHQTLPYLKCGIYQTRLYFESFGCIPGLLACGSAVTFKQGQVLKSYYKVILLYYDHFIYLPRTPVQVAGDWWCMHAYILACIDLPYMAQGWLKYRVIPLYGIHWPPYRDWVKPQKNEIPQSSSKLPQMQEMQHACMKPLTSLLVNIIEETEEILTR